MKKNELKKSKLIFCAKITYPWMASHVFLWKDKNILKTTKDQLFRKNLKYLVEEFVPVINKCRKQNNFDNLFTNCVEFIRKQYEPYQDECCFGKYAKWVNSYLKVAFLCNCISVKEKFLHCPIDKTIMKILGKNASWSSLGKEEYFECIDLINKRRQEKSIFQWELEQWNYEKIEDESNEN